MYVQMSTAEAVRAKVKPLVDDHSHWILILPPAAFAIAVDLEDRYYRGSKHLDFHLSLGPLGPYPLVAVVLAGKQWLPPRALLTLLKRHGGRTPRGWQITHEDIVIPSCGDERMCQQLASAFFLWLAGLHPEYN